MRDIKLALLVLFHPINAFEEIKRRRSDFNYLPVFILMALILSARLIEIYAVHFPLATIDPREANLIGEAAKMLLPLLIWVISCYAVTAILKGETFIHEILLAACFSMLPYIIFSPILSFITHVMVDNEVVFFRGIQTVMWIWIVLLFAMSVRIMNEYTMSQTISVILISLAGMFLIGVLFIVFYTLTIQVVQFIDSIANEIKMMQMS